MGSMARAEQRLINQVSMRTMLLLLLLFGSTASYERTTVPIDLGWRYMPDPAGPAHGGNAHGRAVNSTAPPADAALAQPTFNDSNWSVVDIPHDASVTGDYAPTENGGEGYLPLARTWYRKRFQVPAEWQSQTVTVVIDGSLSTTTWFLNGAQILRQNPAGYLPTVMELDVKAGQSNLLAAYVDGGLTTGWWYEGSGLMRSARIVVTSPDAAVAPFGVASPAFARGDIKRHGPSPADGLGAASAVVSPTVELSGRRRGLATVRFALLDSAGATIARASASASNAGLATAELTLSDAELWSVARPYLYELHVAVSIDQRDVDATTVPIGIRNLNWDAEQGLKVNEERVKMRGACNHESFTGVGAAIPARVDLLRMQQLRGVGMNSWRASHNPPEPMLLDLADRLGVLVLDENRVLATRENCANCSAVPAYDGDPVSDVGLLAKRDRNHASVAWYSLCNEAGCGPGTLLTSDTVERAKEASYTNDGSRNVGANMIGWKVSTNAPRSPMSDAMDVMGLSHAHGAVIDVFHRAEPDKPLVMTECCSCRSQRGEDADQPHNSTLVHYTSEVAQCMWTQTQVSDGPEYVAGSFVWTLHDYIGEPGKWPHVSSSFGAIDLAGFPKENAWFYRSMWLAGIPETDAGRPPLQGQNWTIRIVEHWSRPQPPNSGGVSGDAASVRTIHCYTNAPLVMLELNGIAVTPSPLPSGNFHANCSDRWPAYDNGSTSGDVPAWCPAFRTLVPAFTIQYSPGTLIAKALAADGTTVLATHAISSWGLAVGLKLTLDAPSAATGTGDTVFADGKDVALLRATIVDAAGHPVLNATNNVSFVVDAGPGFVVGVGNGDPACKEPPQASWRSAYHGLVRCIIRVTVDATGTSADRALRAVVNAEAGKGFMNRSSIVLQGEAPAVPNSITVRASAPGLMSASVVIPVSADPKHAVLAVAARSVGVADTGRLEYY